MNDLESKLRSLNFRGPPPEWRGSLVGAATVTAGPDWRKWFAPHPAAWVALAAIWLVLALVSQTLDQEQTPAPARVAAGTADRVPDSMLFAFQLRGAMELEPSL